MVISYLLFILGQIIPKFVVEVRQTLHFKWGPYWKASSSRTSSLSTENWDQLPPQQCGYDSSYQTSICWLHTASTCITSTSSSATKYSLPASRSRKKEHQINVAPMLWSTKPRPSTFYNIVISSWQISNQTLLSSTSFLAFPAYWDGVHLLTSYHKTHLQLPTPSLSSKWLAGTHSLLASGDIFNSPMASKHEQQWPNPTKPLVSTHLNMPCSSSTTSLQQWRYTNTNGNKAFSHLSSSSWIIRPLKHGSSRASKSHAGKGLLVRCKQYCLIINNPEEINTGWVSTINNVNVNHISQFPNHDNPFSHFLLHRIFCSCGIAEVSTQA